jgi:hypothetical protein
LHTAPSVAQAQGEFPSQTSLTLNQSAESKRYFQSGRPFLQKYLPFWLANWAERILTGVVPVLLLALPLMKAIPSFITWRELSRLSRAYVQLHAVETGVQAGRLSHGDALARLDALQSQLHAQETNSSQMGKVYETLAQVKALREQLEHKASSAQAFSAAAAPNNAGA